MFPAGRAYANDLTMISRKCCQSFARLLTFITVLLPQVGPEAARQFVCDALLSVLTQADLPGGNAAVAHLLLEALPVQKGAFTPPPTPSCICAQWCCAEHARLAVKVSHQCQGNNRMTGA